MASCSSCITVQSNGRLASANVKALSERSARFYLEFIHSVKMGESLTIHHIGSQHHLGSHRRGVDASKRGCNWRLWAELGGTHDGLPDSETDVEELQREEAEPIIAMTLGEVKEKVGGFSTEAQLSGVDNIFSISELYNQVLDHEKQAAELIQIVEKEDKESIMAGDYKRRQWLYSRIAEIVIESKKQSEVVQEALDHLLALILEEDNEKTTPADYKARAELFSKCAAVFLRRLE